MIKLLKDSKCIDLSKLLVLRSKELGLTDNESYVLLIILMLSDMNIKTVTPPMLLKYSSLTPKRIDSVLSSLLEKGYISNVAGSIRLRRLADKLLKETKEEEEIETNIVDIFEQNFARPLAPFEIEALRSFHEAGYDEEMVVRALKEAVKAQVLSINYIEGILRNWASNGVKSRYIEEQPKDNQIEVSDYKWWLDE